MEVLDSELTSILCSSTTHGIDNENIGDNTPTTPPDGAREYGGDFDFE